MYYFLHLKQTKLKAWNKTTRSEATEKNKLVISYYLRMEARFVLGESRLQF